MWASKMAISARAADGPITARTRATAITAPFTADILARSPGTADAARAIADGLGVGEGGEDDAARFADPLLVRAPVTAHDAGARRADQGGGAALEGEQGCLHARAEGVMAPRPVAPDDAVAGDDDRHRVGAERIADR